MHVARTSPGTDLWSATITMPVKAQVMTYYFRAQIANTVRWYGDDSDVLEGGPGETYDSENDVLAYDQTLYLGSFHAPSWMTNAVIYQIFPDRFYDGNKSNDALEKTGTEYGYVDTYFHKRWSETPFDGPPCGWSQCYSSDFYGGDLQGVIDKLPYLHELGITAIYLNPIFLAPSDHKYDTSNFKEIDPEFGTLATFKALVADAKEDGIHLILDGVFEDTGSDSVYFNQYNHFKSIGAYQSKKSPYYSWYTFYDWPNSFSDWAGYNWLPTLNENQAVENYIFRKPNSVAQYWLKQGTSGWRLDSADHLSPGYWEAFRKAIKAAYPQSVIIAEPANWTEDAVSDLMGNEWDGVMNYRFREAIMDFFAQGRGANTPSGAMKATQFLQTEMGLLAEYPRPAILSSMNLVDSHDTERILTALEGSKQAQRLVALFQMTWLGAPTILYGDETGIQGIDANAARATFPWQRQDKSLESYYAGIIHLRLKYNALTQGSVAPLFSSDGQGVVAYLREYGKQKIVVVLNDSAKTRTVDIPTPQLTDGSQLKVISPGSPSAHATVHGGGIKLTLGGLSGIALLSS